MILTVLRQDARAKALGDSSDTTFSNDDVDRYLNQYYRQAVEIAMQANGDWQILGEKATKDIEADTRKYALPTDILKLNKVYIKYQSDGKYYKAVQRDPVNIGDEPDQATYGHYPTIPEFDLIKGNIVIYTPATSITAVTAGIKIHYQTDIPELSDTDDEPDLPKFVHKFMTIGAAYEFCQDNEDYKRADRLEKRLIVFEDKIKTHYANRSTTRRLQLTPQEENYF